MGGRGAVGAAVVVWIGLVVGAGTGPGAGLSCLALALALGALVMRAPDRTGTVALMLALALAAAARGSGNKANLERAAHALGDAEIPRWWSARVVDHPWRESGEPLATVTLDGVAGPVRVRVRLPAECEAEWGDRLELLARLEPPLDRRNPGGYSARDAAAAAGVVGQGRALVARVLEHQGIVWPRATLARWRRALERRFDRALSPGARELVTPLVIGDRSGLGSELGARLQASGLTHLLALSGLHVVWLAAVARASMGACGGGVRARALAGAACALLYVGLAGPLASLMRAAATELAVAIARLTGRALDPVQALALSALALLAVAPAWAFDLGFQLSCAATLGLVTIGTAAAEWLRSRQRRRLAALALPLVPTAAAQLFALPLLIARFHALPWTALASNLFAVPVSGLLLAGAWLGAVLELALPGSGGWAFGACELLASGLRAIADQAARVPLALLPTGPAVGPAWLAGIGAVLLTIGFGGPRDLEARRAPLPPWRQAARALGLTMSTLALMLAATAPPLAPPRGRWWMVLLDVGQGDAIALATEQGWWLVDAGPRSPRADAGQRVVLPFLRWAGVRRLEALVLTHDDGDHTGGAKAVGEGLVIERTLAPPPYPRVPGPAARFGAATLARGDTVPDLPAARVLWPPRDLDPARDNQASLVLELGEGAGRALLAADVDSTVEEVLATTTAPALLKVAHHGSGSSSGARVLMRLAPRVALISCGRRNLFGHPHPGALARLGGAGARIHRTDLEGALWFELSASGARRIEWRHGSPHAPIADAASPIVTAVGPLARASPHW